MSTQTIVRRTKHSVYPVFSSEDNDLSAMLWRRDRNGYAKRTTRCERENKKHNLGVMYAHRLVAERVAGRQLTSADIVDHINRDIDNCSRQNLRITDCFGNAQNRTTKHGAMRGTTWFKKCNKWQAGVNHKGRFIYLGLFSDRQEAATAALNKRNELNFLNTNGGAS